MQQAADWYARLYNETADEAQQAAWRRWLAEDPAHLQAWGVVERVSARFTPFREAGRQEPAYNALQAPGNTHIGRRRVLLSIGVLAAGGLLGWRTLRDTPLADHLVALTAEHATSTGERRDLTLTDGSRAWLNTLSALDVDYGQDQRLLHLRAGEILLEASGDPRGPVRVTTRHGEVAGERATFGLCHQNDGLCLSVFAGTAEVTSTSGAKARVEQGMQLTVSPTGELGAPQQVEAARRSWTRGVYVAEGVSLSRFVEELGRHRHGYLGCSPEVATLRVVGSFPLADTEQALDMLPQVLPVRIRRIMPWWVIIEAQA
ncbi:hypothetical protein BBI09_16085 [Stutzerimonas xanthomarina]|nr:hypothetical protein BBI09_16085 [Stutzerimonas xanthomarina]